MIDSSLGSLITLLAGFLFLLGRVGVGGTLYKDS